MRDLELVEQRMEADAVNRGPEPDAERAALVMRAHRDDGMFETGSPMPGSASRNWPER